MKKILKASILVMVVSLLLTGCGKSKEEKDVKNVSGAGATKKIVKANIAEQVLLDKDGVKVTVKSISYYSKYNTDIKLLIENNSEKDIIVQTDNFSINGILINGIVSAHVAAGKKSNDSISIYNDDLDQAGITTIKDIEFDLDILESKSYDEIMKEEGIKLQTDAKNYTQNYNTSGTLIVDQNNVKVYVLKQQNKTLGTEILVYIENNSDKTLTVTSRELSVNGFMINSSFYESLPAGKKAYESIMVYKDDLEDNDIKSIDNIELKVECYDSKSYKDVFETDTIKVEF